MGWTAIKADIRNRLGEPNAGYWSNSELQNWYNEGVALQHRMAYQAVLQLEDRAFAELYENDYFSTFVARSSVQTISAGTADYAVPTGFWRMARLVLVVASIERPCDYSPFADDWDVKNLPHKAPSPSRPKYTITPDKKIRFYVTPGNATVPNATMSYYVYMVKKPATVDIETGAQDTEVLDPFNAAPMAWTCYRAMAKQYDSGDTYRKEFEDLVASIVPGPSKETAERKRA